jgi:hypothetical protein
MAGLVAISAAAETIAVKKSDYSEKIAVAAINWAVD